jgi:ATP-dependent DNA helicase RecQ
MADPRAILGEVYGYAAFRPGQAEAIDAVMAGRDAVVLLPTSAGKSICYQVPAIALAREGRGTTIVVSPLIALMVDQVDALVGRGIAAAALHSHQEDDEQREVIVRFLRGELALLYVSPERATLDSFKRLLGRTRIALLAIDEAHCVSQWGHDFRPEYMRLGELRSVVDAPVIAVTATATPRVMTEIVRSLSLRDPGMVRGDFRRPNLAFSVRHATTDDERYAMTIDALDRAGLRGRSGNGRAIIYCSTRKKTEAVADHLKANGFAVGHYHAGRTALARDRMHTSFAAGKTRVLVATSAFGMGVDYPDVRITIHSFGMGVDYPDVRITIHFQTPGSVEAYYQEAGRAGRDGLPSSCLMLFGASDLMTQRRLGERGGTLHPRLEDALAAIEKYAHGRECRQHVLCSHFAAPVLPLFAAAAATASTASGGPELCGRCDVCVDPESLLVVPVREPVAVLPGAEQQLIIDAVTQLSRSIGKTNLARALRGSKAKAMSAHGLLHLPQHGALAHQSEASIIAAIEGLIRDRRLIRRGRKYPTVALPGAAVRRSSRTNASMSSASASAAAAAPRNARFARSSRPTRTVHGIKLALDTYRKQKARQLKWKSYMVFQRSTIAAIDARRPQTLADLAKIPGLGPAKIARFGDDILALVRRHLDA